jgi:serine/threonine protein kinase
MTKHNENTKSFKSKAEQIKLEELSITKKLGSGQFGVVYLASHKGQFYALKCIEKSQIIECKL